MRKSYREQKEQRTKRRRSRSERRKSFKKISQQESKKLQEEMRKLVSECGLTPGQIADFSGYDASNIRRILKGYRKSAQMDTFLALLKVAGYSFKIMKNAPEDDDFREHRRFPPPPLEKSNDNDDEP